MIDNERSFINASTRNNNTTSMEKFENACVEIINYKDVIMVRVEYTHTNSNFLICQNQFSYNPTNVVLL